MFLLFGGERMITSLLLGLETTVIVRLHHAPSSLHIFQSKTWNRALIMKSVHWDPPVPGIKNSGFRPGGSESECNQMKQNYSEPDPLRSLDICVHVCEKGGLSNTAEPDANFQEFYKCEKVAQWCIVALMVSSLRTEAMLIYLLSCSVESLKHRNGCHLQAVTTCSEIFYGVFIKISFYKKPCLFSEGFLMRFWLFVFPCDFTIIFSSVGFHAKLLEYYICLSVSLSEKRRM